MRLPEPVSQLVERVARNGAGRNVVFDADGTLWRGDVGEDFLRHALHAQLFDGRYETYETLLSQSHARAYGWAVEVMRDVPLSTLTRACDDFFQQRFQGRVFPFVRPLLARLTAAGCVPWICSASPLWTVLPGARMLGIDPEHVIGVSCAVEAGCLTGAVDAPVPVGDGKVTWLKRREVKPLLAVGNGDLDLDMLAHAEHALVIGPPDSENELVREGRRRGWPILKA